MHLATFIQIGLPAALFCVMLAMGMTLGVADFARVVKRPRPFLVGLAAQMAAVPVLALAVALVFALPPELAVGLLVLSFCPAGTTSNLFSWLARADVALSISLTAAASVITPFTIPLLSEAALAWAIGAERELPFPVARTMVQLALVTLMPVSLGMTWRSRWTASARRWQPLVNRFAMTMFAVVIASIIVQQWDVMPGFLARTGTACSVLVVLAMLAGFLVARCAGLDARQTRTLAIEVGMQNGGTALIVTQGVLASPTMSIVPVVYGLLMLVPVLVLVTVSRARDRLAAQPC